MSTPHATGSLDDIESLRRLADISHAVITGHQHASGAYPASPEFSAYKGYAWLRDGAFTAEGISRYGDVESVNRFHDWVELVLLRRREQVDALVAQHVSGKEPPVEAMLPTRFTLDGSTGNDPWWDFQTDGYGTWLWSLVAHCARHNLDATRWKDAAGVAVDYLCAFWERPCYDWWEEHVEHRHVSTLAAIYGGLRAAGGWEGMLDAPALRRVESVTAQIANRVAAEGIHEGHLAKWLGAHDVDGSLPAAIVPFGLVAVTDEPAQLTREAVRSQLCIDGGVHRYLQDTFYGGGQWLLLTALLGWNEAVAGNREVALQALRWVAAHARPDGEMPEQVTDHLLFPDRRQEWIDRWGSVATPLLWSHGMYLILADELGLLDGDGR